MSRTAEKARTLGRRQGRRPLRLSLLLAALAALGLLLLGGCGDDASTDGTTAPSVTTTATTEALPGTSATTAPATTGSSGPPPAAPAKEGRVSVYFALGEKIQPVGRTVPNAAEPARGAVEALLEGPSATEQDRGVTTSVPAGTTLRGLTIANGVATVDLSREFESGGGSLSMQMRLAQLVYTLTQFPTVSSVALRLEGTPVTALGGEGVQTTPPRDRADFEDLTPAILVESPVLGATVKSPLTVSGTANTFEATFMLELTDWDGRIVAQEQVTASSGSGTRGTFRKTVDFDVDRAGNGALIVFELSAKDGSRTNLVEIPLLIEK